MPAMSPSSPLLERIRQQLHPRYEVERELGVEAGGGLFLARDVSLQRLVAVKVLDTGVAGDTVSRRFLREARILAHLTHPNIVAIHDSNESGGLAYYVRDYLEGETLSSRLARGRLPPREAIALGGDLLAALGAAHRSGVIHRDVRPGNVFCLPDRAVLTDFGLARPVGSTDSTDAGTISERGRSEYTPPEQLAGGEATSRSDLYSAGAILYHALTGRVWPGGAPSGWLRWLRVPRRLKLVLRRSLAPAPADRWSDAAAFTQALEAPEERSGIGRRILYLAAAAAGLWALWLVRPVAEPLPGAIPRELAIVPFETKRALGDAGADLAHLVELNLAGLPGLSLTPWRQVKRWWDSHGGSAVGVEKGRAARELRVHWLAHGLLDRQGDSLLVRLTLYDSTGRKIPVAELRARAGGLGPLSDTLALLLVRTIAPRLAGSYGVVRDLATVPLPALTHFFRGENAFQRDEWARAEHHFGKALDLDSTFALAAWRLANVKRWRRLPYDDDLRVLYAREEARLRPLDRSLIHALSDSQLDRRFSKLDSTTVRFPDDAYARLLYGDELFHRGPLVGREFDEGTRVMADAIARDSSLMLAYDHLIVAAIRNGDRDGSRRMIGHRRRAGAQPSGGDPDVLALVDLAYDERFVPWRGRLRRLFLSRTADSAQLDGVTRLFRTGVSWFDLPEAQVALGDLLLRAGSLSPPTRGSAHLGKALGLMTLGRPQRALEELDSAAALLDSDEARLEQAAWRVALPALGLPLPADGTDWRSRLAALWSDSALGPRAAWTLALGAYAAGDTVELQRCRERLESAEGGARDLERFVGAMIQAARGQWAAAVAASDSSSTALNATRPPDPFARSAFHLLRGHWLAAAGDTAAAGHEWLWHENSDVEGWPGGVSQAGEVDGMLGAYARLVRARALLRPGVTQADHRAGCAFINRVLELWSAAEPAARPLRDEAGRLARRCAA
jgi:tetratricopeptide (TPR) repeat protein